MGRHTLETLETLNPNCSRFISNCLVLDWLQIKDAENILEKDAKAAKIEEDKGSSEDVSCMAKQIGHWSLSLARLPKL